MSGAGKRLRVPAHVPGWCAHSPECWREPAIGATFHRMEPRRNLLTGEVLREIVAVVVAVDPWPKGECHVCRRVHLEGADGWRGWVQLGELWARWQALDNVVELPHRHGLARLEERG